MLKWRAIPEHTPAIIRSSRGRENDISKLSFLDFTVGWLYLHSEAAFRRSGPIAGSVRVVLRAQDVASLSRIAVIRERLTYDTWLPLGSTRN